MQEQFLDMLRVDRSPETGKKNFMWVTPAPMAMSLILFSLFCLCCHFAFPPHPGQVGGYHGGYIGFFILFYLAGHVILHISGFKQMPRSKQASMGGDTKETYKCRPLVLHESFGREAMGEKGIMKFVKRDRGGFGIYVTPTSTGCWVGSKVAKEGHG
jgi:hypothetical protein